MSTGTEPGKDRGSTHRATWARQHRENVPTARSEGDGRQQGDEQPAPALGAHRKPPSSAPRWFDARHEDQNASKLTRYTASQTGESRA